MPALKMNPAEAASIMRRFLKPTIAGPQLGGGAGGVDAADIVNLSTRRQQQEDELAHNLDVQQELAKMPAPVARGPIAAAQPSGVIGVSGATPSDLASVRRDISQDPFTGDEAQARGQKIENALSDAELTTRPEIERASQATNTRNAFGAFLTKQAGYKADISPEGTGALDAASLRKIREGEALAGAKVDAKGLSAEGTKSATALHQAYGLGQKLHQLLTDKLKANPELARQEDTGNQLLDVATARTKRWLYGQGVLQAPEGYDEATQLADWMKVLATRGLLGGVRNIEWINQIQDHLAAGRLPPAASLARLEVFLKEAPGLEKEIYDVEKGHELLPGSPGAPGGRVQPSAAPVVLPQQPALGDLYSRYQNRRAPGQ